MSKNKKGAKKSMAQKAAEDAKKREQEMDKNQDQQVAPETPTGEIEGENPIDGNEDDDPGEEKPSFKDKVVGWVKNAWAFVVKWVLKPLAIAVVLLASVITVVTNVLTGSNDEENEDSEQDRDDVIDVDYVEVPPTDEEQEQTTE